MADSAGEGFSFSFPKTISEIERLAASGEIDVIISDFSFASGAFADWLSLWPLPCVLLLDGSESAERVEQALHDESSFFLQTDTTTTWIKLLPILIRKACAVREAVSRQNTHLAMTEHLYLNLIQAIPDIVYILDGSGNFRYLNDAIKTLGWDPMQLIGKHFSTILHPQEAKHVGRDTVMDEYARRKPGEIWENHLLFDERRSGGRMTRNLELRLQTANPGTDTEEAPENWRLGSINAYGEINAVGFTMPEFKDVLVGTIGVIRDVSIRREHEQALEANLRSREILLQEIHHRVKTNLQIVSSILNLQEGILEDERSKTVFLECQTQIQTMAIVHEQIYCDGDVDSILLTGLLENLSSYLGQFYETESRGIRIEVDSMTQSRLDLNSALPVALIVNELLSNSFKHAFPENRAGNVKIRLEEDEQNRLCIEIRDNGIGLAASRATERPGKPRTIGLDLVDALVEQIHGTLEQLDENGSRSILRFAPPDKSQE